MWSGGTTQPTQPQPATPTPSQPTSYGVRFYDLYESFPAGLTIGDDDSNSNDRKRRWASPLVWRLSFWTGFALLMMGSIVLLLAYLWPRRETIIGGEDEDDMLIIDNSAVQFNQFLTDSKLTGLALFSIGGTVFGITLLLPSLVGAYCLDSDADDDEEMDLNMSSFPPVSSSQEPTDKSGVPVTERLKAIQPKLDRDASKGVGMDGHEERETERHRDESPKPTTSGTQPQARST